MDLGRLVEIFEKGSARVSLGKDLGLAPIRYPLSPSGVANPLDGTRSGSILPVPRPGLEAEWMTEERVRHCFCRGTAAASSLRRASFPKDGQGPSPV